jgi:hypothetical protein
MLFLYSMLLYWIVESFWALCMIRYPSTMWVRHYTTSADMANILKRGFNPPHNESKAILKGIVGGQQGEDRVSFSVAKDECYKKMVEAYHGGLNGYSGSYGYIYLELPVRHSIITTADIYTLFGKQSFGMGLELTVDRRVVNDAISKGNYCLQRPAKYFSLAHYRAYANAVYRCFSLKGVLKSFTTAFKASRALKMNTGKK